MSPHRRKGRGGGGSKTMALLPNSSLISPLTSAAKISKEHRRFTIANLVIDSKEMKHRILKTDPPAVIPRVSDENAISERENEDAFRASELEKADSSQGWGEKPRVSRLSKTRDIKKKEIRRPPERKTETSRSSSTKVAEIPKNSDMKNSHSSRNTGKRVDTCRFLGKKEAVPRVSNIKAVDVPRISVTDSSKPRSTSAFRCRDSSTGSFKAAKSLPIVRNSVPDQCSSRSDLTVSKYGFPDKSRAESRGKSSPNISNLHCKEVPKKIPDEYMRSCSSNVSNGVMERKIAEESVKPTPKSIRMKGLNSNIGEGVKRISKVSTSVEEKKRTLRGISCKVDSSSTEKKVDSKNSMASYLNENQADKVRWSTSVLPSSSHVNNGRKASLDSVKMESYGAKSLVSKQDFPKSGRFSTGSSTISSSKILKTGYENVQSKHGLSKDSLYKFGDLQRLSKESKIISCTHNVTINKNTQNELDLSNLLQRRLSLLEEKVNRISAELRKTKTILNCGDSAHSMSFLSNIQDKICSIERSMSSQQCDDAALLHDIVMEDEFQLVSVEEGSRYSLECNRSNSRIEDGPPQCDEEQCDYAEQPSLQRGDSGEITHNSEYTCVQTIDSGHLESSIQSALISMSNGGTESNVLEPQALGSHELVRKLPRLTIEDAKDFLECDESLPLNSFHENMENVAPGFEQYCEYDSILLNDLHPIGDKVAMAGWYVSDGDAILLAHDDGCCSYIDIANMEEKAIFESPDDIAMPVWNDCWLIRAPGSDGRANKYVVAASTGNVIDCGFCSWDFESKSLASCHCEYLSTQQTTLSEGNSTDISLNRKISSKPHLILPLSECKAPQHDVSRRVLAEAYHNESCKSPQWWFKPSGPLMAATASSLTNIVLYDIRDGDNVMQWDTKTAIMSLDYTSPIQWRDRGKLVLAEEEAISIWDVQTMDVHCLQYVQLPGKQISTLYVHNSDAECSGGVRQRLSSSETESFDGICCTQDDINVLDFRVPNGIGISFPSHGLELQCAFARRDMVLVGGLDHKSHQCFVQQWSVRKAMPVCTYSFPSSSSRYTHLSLTQVWGSSSLVMAMNGNGVYIFNAWKDSGEEVCELQEMNNVIGTHDLLDPSFDYANSRILLISRDRPATWSYLAQ